MLSPIGFHANEIEGASMVYQAVWSEPCPNCMYGSGIAFGLNRTKIRDTDVGRAIVELSRWRLKGLEGNCVYSEFETSI